MTFAVIWHYMNKTELNWIHEEHRASMANLPILVFSGKSQSPFTLLGCKHKPHLWTSGLHTILMESVSDNLSRNMHINGLLEVILQGSGSAPPVPLCTKEEVADLLLGCCPPTAPSTSPGVLACLLVSPPYSGRCAERHSKPSCHSSHWCAILDELHYLSNFCGCVSSTWPLFLVSVWILRFFLSQLVLSTDHVIVVGDFNIQ